MCQQFLEDKLVSPKTAQYPDFNQRFVTLSSGPNYHIEAYVDSQNQYGALIRSEWFCAVEHIEGRWWRLKGLTVKSR